MQSQVGLFQESFRQRCGVRYLQHAVLLNLLWEFKDPWQSGQTMTCLQKIKTFHQRQCWIKPTQKDHDLWCRLNDLIKRLGDNFCGVVKVVSHQDLSGSRNELEWWAFSGNSAADNIATTILQSHPLLGKLWEQARQDVAIVKMLQQQAHRVFVEVGKRSVLFREPQKDLGNCAVCTTSKPWRCSRSSVSDWPWHWSSIAISDWSLGELIRWLTRLKTTLHRSN